MHLFKIIAADGATLTVCAEDYDTAADDPGFFLAR